MSGRARELAVRAFVRFMGPHDQAGPLKKRLGSFFLRRGPGQLTCTEFESFVYDYYEGALTPKQRRTFDLHMRLCPMCRTHFESYVRTIELGQKLCEDEERLPNDMPEELVGAILAAVRRR